MPETQPDQLTPAKIQSLSPQLRKAARFVVENPGEIATRSQRYIARTTKIPAPTFTRLARAIGCETYDELRDMCRNEVLNKRTFLADKVQVQIHQGGNEESFVAQNLKASVLNLETLLTSLDPKEMARIIAILSRARNVVLIGRLSAKPIVDYAAYLANMSIGHWRTLGLESGALANDLADLEECDACVVFSVQPYSSKAVELSEIVARKSVPLIVVTDSPAAPAAALATHCIYIDTESSQFFPSHGAAIVLFETLIGMLIQEVGHKARDRIAKIEQQNHQLGDYWRDKPASKKGEDH